MIVLLIVGCALGYGAIGFVVSAVSAARHIDTHGRATAFGVDVMVGIFWPALLVAGAAWIVGWPFPRAWKYLVRRLNPTFVGEINDW